MAHMLILGGTEQGKSTFARKLHDQYKKAGQKTLVLDSIDYQAWNGDFATDDPDAFLKTFWDSRNCMVFVDEAGDAVGRYDQAMIQTATKGRHWGHCVHFISQRSQQLSATVRAQCSQIVLFNLSRSDCDIHAREWNRPQFLEVSTYPPGRYMMAGRNVTLPVQNGDAFT